MLFKEIQHNIDSQIPFVIYRKPKKRSVFYLKQQTKGLSEFVFCSFLQDIRLSFFFKRKIRVNNQIEKATKAIKLPEVFFEDKNISQVEYQKKVAEAIDYIKSGRAEKIVFSRTLSVKKKIDLLQSYRQLLVYYPNAFCYIWFHPRSGIWMGATPELLLKIDGLQLQTIALAGTKTTHEQWTKKEIQEQKVVSDYIKTQLAPLSHSVKTSQVKTVSQGKLEHLQTKISAKLLSKNYDSVIEKIHPTPAICGIPIKQVKEFLKKHESYNRLFYSGFLGETNDDSLELYVNLRCVELGASHAKLYVGGGINELSNPYKEWQETELKLQVVQRCWVLANN